MRPSLPDARGSRTEKVATSEPTRVSRICIALALGSLVLRLALIARPITILDRLFVPDDTYYTLAVARSLARGLGPSVDGTHFTSGFQPLLAFLLAPVLRLVDSPDTAFRCALAIGAIADATTTWLIGLFTFWAGRTTETSTAGESRRAAIVASGTWLLSSSAIATALNGLETSLAIACTLGALTAWLRARRSGNVLAWLATGALFGLCLLARVDTCFLVAIALGATFIRAGLRAASVSAGGALLVVGPWWAYGLARFGSIIPESGAAVREQALRYKAMGLVIRDQLAWAAAAVTGPPFFDSTWLRQALGSGASAIGCAVAIVFVLVALAVARGARRNDGLRILAVHAVCIFLFYALYLPATWFFRRYLVPVHVFVVISGAIVIARQWDRRRDHPRPAWALLGGGGACLVAALVTIFRFATSTPAISPDQGHHGAKGYREPAMEILKLAPADAVIGSFQSGALGWFSDGSGRTIVNLDGVVDGEAARALRQHQLATFARSRRITHLADWEVNLKLFFERSGDAQLSRASLRELGSAEAQGKNERFVLYAITWPDER
jgi:hypothetical protein